MNFTYIFWSMNNTIILSGSGRVSTLVSNDSTILNEKNFAYVESSKFSMLVDHEKNALGAGYIVEFIHDATENY